MFGGQGEGDGDVEEVGQQLRDGLFGGVEAPDPPGTLWVLLVALEEEHGEGEQAQHELHQHSEPPEELALSLFAHVYSI